MKVSTSILKAKLKLYYRLTKPGIIYGNWLTATAGFFLADGLKFDFGRFFAMLGGLGLVVASACVINNYLDKEIDVKMARTKRRATAAGQISAAAAISYGSVLLVIGLFCLGFFVNALSLLATVAGWLVYIGLYTPLKRRSQHATLVGSIAGAIPPVVGYSAASGGLDTEAALLFLILVFWQMPHFYSIAVFRSAEYQAAGIPVWPLVRGLKNTKLQIITYILAFLIAAGAMTFLNYTGYFYLAGMALVSLLWLRRGIKGFKEKNSNHWARQMFGFSLITILVWSLLSVLDRWLQ